MTAYPLTLGVSGVVWVGAAIGDTLLGAALAGGFSLANTVLGIWLVREQRRTRKVLTAPRKLVYDAQGRPIGTVLDLRREADDWLPVTEGQL